MSWQRTVLSFALVLPLLCNAASQDDLKKLAALKIKPQTRIDLSNTDLRNYEFTPDKIDLHGANLAHSNLSGVNLSKMNLGGADLSYADLSGAKLNQTNLAEANLDHANLSGAEIEQSDLSKANLYAANLISAKIHESILTKANLTCANLNQADLSKSTFTETIISGASFVNTITADINGYESVIDDKLACEAKFTD